MYVAASGKPPSPSLRGPNPGGVLLMTVDVVAFFSRTPLMRASGRYLPVVRSGWYVWDVRQHRAGDTNSE